MLEQHVEYYWNIIWNFRWIIASILYLTLGAITGASFKRIMEPDSDISVFWAGFWWPLIWIVVLVCIFLLFVVIIPGVIAYKVSDRFVHMMNRILADDEAKRLKREAEFHKKGSKK